MRKRRPREMLEKRCAWLGVGVALLLTLACGGAAAKKQAPPKMDATFQRVGNKAMSDFQQGRYQAAYDGFVELQGLQPDNHELFVAGGQALSKLGDLKGALAQYEKAIMLLAPTGQKTKALADPYTKIGELFTQLGDYVQAKRAFDDAILADPALAHSYVLRGHLAQQFDQYNDAEADFLKATQLEPLDINGWNGLGVAWMYLEHACQPVEGERECKPAGYDSYDEGSIAALRKVMALNPGNMITLSNLVMAENRCCDWQFRDKHLGQMRAALRDAAARKRNFAPPFHALEYGYSPKELLVNSKYLSKEHQDSVRDAKKKLGKNPARSLTAVEKNGHRLNVGYTNGAGFHNGTTTARCLRSMFRFHDPTRVKVVCYPLGGDDKSEERQAIKSACTGGWVEGAAMTDAELAAKVAEDQIHILVDSTGYTMKYRADFLALTTAPIVLSFHGFPGTMAAKFVHYLAADARTVPPEYQGFYTEKLALVPWTYLVNDHKQSRREVLASAAAAAAAPTRAQLGFADDDIVLASFNQLYKIEPAVFGAWLRVLKKEPRAKLWLLNFSKAASKYLRKHAAEAGVAPDRLRFHNKFPKETELLAKGHADLFLDTPLFNAHTTGGDVLWAGLPVVTLPGENFAQRVASGLVYSAHLGSTCVARNLAEYERLVLALCRQAQARGRLREELRSHREHAPLFDTELLTHHVETTMKMMWEVFAAGLAPRHVVHATDRQASYQL